MRRGVWHQCGARNQKLIREQLESGAGVGVIISPCDLSFQNAAKYARMYHDLGAEVLIDDQFYIPDSTKGKLSTYPVNESRATISALNQISEEGLNGFSSSLQEINAALITSAIIAPGVVYEAGRGDIVELNARLFSASKRVGDNLGVPTYASVALGNSVTSAVQTIGPVISAVTSLNADGWYLCFEFEPERIPTPEESVLRFCRTGLTLAATGRPVMHAFAGPMSLLSFAFGGQAAGVGHWQNLWRFSRERWQELEPQGGGGDAPPRFFSANLWGTIVYPDEFDQLPTNLRNLVYTPSPFSTPVGSRLHWERWDANKHLLNTICIAVGNIASNINPRVCLNDASTVLRNAVNLLADISATGLILRDRTDTYQLNWANALDSLLNTYPDDFEYLELLS